MGSQTLCQPAGAMLLLGEAALLMTFLQENPHSYEVFWIVMMHVGQIVWKKIQRSSMCFLGGVPPYLSSEGCFGARVTRLQNLGRVYHSFHSNHRIIWFL